MVDVEGMKHTMVLYDYYEGMKVCQKGCCTCRSRPKQMSKWERESKFRASSVLKEALSLCVCLQHTLCTCLVTLLCGSTILCMYAVASHQRAGPE